MSFNSFSFWCFFPIIFGVYWFIPVRLNQIRKAFLVVVSYILYLNWKPSFAFVLLGVSIITYIGGRVLYAEKEKHRKKRLVRFFALLGLLPLLVFKYYNFINESVSDLLAVLGLKYSMPGLNLAIPIGISFFTFQSVGYLLDVYHSRVTPEKNIVDYLLFVSFFPQITVGPISTAEELLPQIKATHYFNYEQGKRGLKLLLWGMFLKAVIADRLGLYVNVVYDNYIHYNGSTCLIASVFYAIQIYCDFGGYSLMAVGIARTLGFNLADNFRRPYLAVSVTDFWKRWHVTLTRWLKWHIFIPLGGSRCGKFQNYFNILVTFFVSGIWHGANWTFILWGTMQGFLLIFEKILGLQKYEGNCWFVRLFRIIFTFLIVNFTLIFFRSSSINNALEMIGKILSGSGHPSFSFIDLYALCVALLGLIFLSIKDIKDEFFDGKIKILKNRFVGWAVYLLLVCIILNYGVLDGGQFIYVKF